LGTGGNSHQRAVGAKAVGPARPEPPTTSNMEASPSVGLWRSIFGWHILLRWDVLGSLVPGFFIAAGLAMLAVDWFPSNLLFSQISFAVAAALVITKTLGHAYAHQTSSNSEKAVFALLICGVTVVATTMVELNIQVHKRVLREVANFSIPMSADVYAGHKKGDDVYGLKWPDDSIQDVRLQVNNNSDYLLQDLDATIESDSGPIFGIREIGDSVGCKFSPLYDDLAVRFRGSDGSSMTIHSGDMFAGSNTWAVRWKIFCPIILSRTNPRFVVAIGAQQASLGELKIFGRYKLESPLGGVVRETNSVVRIVR
jgi:hypothetical protein